MTETAAPARAPRLGRLERPALTGVLVREIVNFSSYWRSATFSSTVEPTIYLLAFGFGFGSLVSKVAGYDYVQFVGTGVVATAVPKHAQPKPARKAISGTASIPGAGSRPKARATSIGTQPYTAARVAIQSTSAVTSSSVSTGAARMAS